ncbi:predicted protein [Histoplasma mississippiense (nom. inval.)]|uniref:predicted protein n=1 Tax=Ajellomyces capsulatus (strain NAm1 / WU24) TaxID=2059318 RepID=UPI000157B837|nr:predicted protein [Histoplasma mississippiense (nom. inval.)]EDN03262.1 predicted protein [Histoplasma mississippiense (nom. inval.)]
MARVPSRNILVRWSPLQARRESAQDDGKRFTLASELFSDRFAAEIMIRVINQRGYYYGMRYAAGEEFLLGKTEFQGEHIPGRIVHMLSYSGGFTDSGKQYSVSFVSPVQRRPVMIQGSVMLFDSPAGKGTDRSAGSSPT